MTQSSSDASIPGQDPQDAPGIQGIPQAPPVPSEYGYGTQQPMAVPPGMHYDEKSGLLLPEGVELAGVGRRIGAWFLSLVLSVITLGIGYLIWGLIAWGKGRGPAMQVLGLRCWTPSNGRPAGWGTMALRDIVGYIAQQIIPIVGVLVSFILFLTGKQRKSLMDLVGGTVVVYDPNKVLDTWQA